MVAVVVVVYVNVWSWLYDRTLLSVDDLVAAVVETLEETGLASKTYIFYSSE